MAATKSSPPPLRLDYPAVKVPKPGLGRGPFELQRRFQPHSDSATKGEKGVPLRVFAQQLLVTSVGFERCADTSIDAAYTHVCISILLEVSNAAVRKPGDFGNYPRGATRLFWRWGRGGLWLADSDDRAAGSAAGYDMGLRHGRLDRRVRQCEGNRATLHSCQAEMSRSRRCAPVPYCHEALSRSRRDFYQAPARSFLPAEFPRYRPGPHQLQSI